jgi:hypothetical protein
VQHLDFEFLKDRYDFELDRKDKLTDALNLPVGILGGLGSLLALMARSFSYQDSVLTWAFAPFLVAAILAFVACLVQLGRTYHRQTYVYLPLLETLVQWEDENREFLGYVERTGGTSNEAGLPSYVRMRIIEAADRNTGSNDERSSLLYWARVWLFAVLMLTAFAGIPYVADQVRYSNAKAGKSTTNAAADASKHEAATDSVSAES